MPVPAVAPTRHRRRVGAPDPTRRDGSLALELAMVLPLVALVAVGVLQLVGVARDALLAQDLARLGVRVAATTTADGPVRDAVARGAGPGVATTVTVTPAGRGRGDTVVVEVVVTRAGRWFDVAVTGRAAAAGEPVLGRAGGT